MTAVRVRVGAQLEPGATAIFQPLILAARQARTKIGAEGHAMGSDFVGGYRSAPAHAKAAGDALVSIAQKTAAQITAAERRAAREREKDAEHVYQVRQRYLEAEAKAAEKALAKRQKTGADIGKGAWSTVSNVAGRAVGAVGTVARGAGVDLDIGASVGRAVKLSARAVDVVNQATLSGQAQGPGAAKNLESMARNVGGRTGIGAEGAMDVFAAFQAKSSDLETAKKVLPELAELARGTGTNMADMANAAASVNAQLEESPDKAEKLLAIMRHITKQTADGQVEMSDFAKFMPRIASGANAFSGDYSHNIGALGAISQMSIKGGASDAAEATNSAAAFGRDLRKAHTIKAFAAEGLTGAVYGKNHELKDPQEIIIAALKKTGGDQARMGKLFGNVASYRGIDWARHLFTTAGGGKAGEKAVRAEFGKYGATISPEQIKAMADAANATDAAKVERFNAQLDRIVATSAEKLLPALEKLAPLALKAAEGIGELAAWATEHPWGALGAVVAASLAKEIAGAGIKALLQGALSSALGGLGAAGAPLAIVAGAIAVEQVGELVIDKVMAAKDKAADEARDKPFVEHEQQRIANEIAAGRPLDEEDRKALAKEQTDLSVRIGAAKEIPTDALGYLLGGVGRAVTGEGGGAAGYVKERDDANNLASLEARMAEVTAQLQRNNALLGGTINVNVQNQPGSPVGPGARGTRTGPDAH